MAIPILGQASFANAGRQGSRTYIQFGGLAVPVGNNFGAVLASIDLNDGVVWAAQDLMLPDSHELEIAQQLWRAKQTYVSEDWGPLEVHIPFEYNGPSIFAARQLMTYGEQYLTFDGTHAYTVRCKTLGSTHLLMNGIRDGKTDNPWWSGELGFVMKEPFYKTIAQSSQLGQAVAGSSGAGAQTNYSITYNGTFFAEPQWILNVPGGNGQIITQLKIANTTSGETAVINLNIPASQAHTVTVDSSVFSVLYDAAAVDIGGSFPMLYPGVNNMTITIVSAGATTGLTLDAKWFERWA